MYNATKILDDHPGGDDLILQNVGKDIGDAMVNPSEHDHSLAAYDILKEYAIGKISTAAAVIRDGV